MYHGWCPFLMALATTAVALPSDYSRIEGKGFYRAFVDPVEWADALKACRLDKGSLAEVSSEDEAVVVGNVLRAAGVQHPAFVGFHNMFNPDQYYYVSGSRLTMEVLSLLMRQNVTDTDSRCGAVDTNGMLSMENCGDVRPFVCKLPLWRGYEKTNDGFYRLSQEAVSWEEARASCEKEDAHLVIINSYQEAKMLTVMMERHPYTPESTNSSLVAVGVHNQFKKELYISVKGELLKEVGFLNWAQDEPDNGDIQQDKRCVFLYRETSQLVDGRCDDRHAFICEREMPSEEVKKINRYGDYNYN